MTRAGRRAPSTLRARSCSRPRARSGRNLCCRLPARLRLALSGGGRRCTGGQCPDGTWTGHRASAIGHRTTWRELRVSDRRPATMWSLGLGLSPLELPRREAPDVDVELVQAGVVAVALELNPKLQFFPRYGQVANRAQVSDPRAAPCTVGTTGRGGRLGPLKNLIGESGGPPIQVGDTGPIGHEAASVHVVSVGVHGW